LTTLADYKYGGHDVEVRQTIAEVMENESPLLRVLTFDELTDNNVSRQRMYEDGDVQEHAVGDTWTVVNPTWEYRDAPLTILGDNVTVDEFGDLASGQKGLMASQIEEKARQLSRRFDKNAIYAQTTTYGAFTGSAMVGLLLHIARCETATTTDLDGWIYTGNSDAANNKQAVFAASGASAALTIAMLEALRDAVRPKATDYLMSLLMRRKLDDLCRATGTNLDVSEGKAGQIITRFGEQRVTIISSIKDNMTDSTSLVTAIASYDYTQAIAAGKDTSPIFAVAIGKTDFTGINGKGMIQVVDLAGGKDMESLDAKGKRVKAYLGLALRRKTSVAVLLNANYSG